MKIIFALMPSRLISWYVEGNLQTEFGIGKNLISEMNLSLGFHQELGHSSNVG